MKKILHIIGWLSFAVLTIVALSFAEKTRLNTRCTELDIQVDTSEQINFVTKHDIKRMIFNRFDSVKSIPMKNIPMNKIEKALNADPYIKSADIYPTINGKLGITIVQRKPMFRVMGYGKYSFYYDKDGQMMPLSEKYTANVIPVIFDEKWNDQNPKTKIFINKLDTIEKADILKQTYVLIDYIQRDSLMNAMVDHIFVSKDKEFEIVPRAGKHVVEFGTIDQYKRKFKNLTLIYTKGLKTVGWTRYKKINLKYKNQIVCTKR